MRYGEVTKWECSHATAWLPSGVPPNAVGVSAAPRTKKTPAELAEHAEEGPSEPVDATGYAGLHELLTEIEQIPELQPR